MQTQTDLRLPPTIRVAHTLSRILTWGMPADERTQTLAESLADWEAMEPAEGPGRVLARALRGIPAGVWARLNDRDITAMPAAVAVAVLGLAGLVAGMQPAAYPAQMRMFIALGSTGLILSCVNLLRSPRRIITSRYRFPGLLLSTGFIGIAHDLPAAPDWAYDTPVIESLFIDLTAQFGFVAMGVGFTMLAGSSFLPGRRVAVLASGVTIMIGLALFAISQITWGVWAASVDSDLALASVLMGLASLSFIHLMPRLRHLEIT